MMYGWFPYNTENNSYIQVSEYQEIILQKYQVQHTKLL